MVQGTGSHVGKSVLITALCRIFRQEGFSVAPFKAQNMSNNAFVCADGGEIARAQTLQAAACGLQPKVEMNPVLLKPYSDSGSQVVVMGKPVKTMGVMEYQKYKADLIPVIRRCLDQLKEEYDLVLIEGAGSPAEINLREYDIVNMKTAELADAPVILVGDIDFGGVFAQLIGTLHLLTAEEKKRVRGFVINKFRGEIEILKPGLDYLERETRRKLLGVLPYFHDIQLPEEDSLARHSKSHRQTSGCVRIDVVRHPRIANFTDFDALESEPDVSLRYLERPDNLVPDAVLIPGTKSTIPDLRRLKTMGFPEHIERCKRAGGMIVGICGGFQMMGERLSDPNRVDSNEKEEKGLCLLPATTVFRERKRTAQVRAFHIKSGSEVNGYEIHMGKTQVRSDSAFRIVERLGRETDELDGASSKDGRTWGTYIHGLFDNLRFRRNFLNELRASKGWAPLEESTAPDLDANIDKLANLARENLDLESIRQIVASGS